MGFGETEFGGLVWFSYVVLILALLVGYFVLRLQKGRKKQRSRPRLDERSDFERELQAEIEAAEGRKGTVQEGSGAEEEAPQALELPRKVQEQMEELRKKAGP